MKPVWTHEPCPKVIEALAREHLYIQADDRCNVTFHAKGCFDKLYRVGTSGMRVTLPVDPYFKDIE